METYLGLKWQKPPSQRPGGSGSFRRKLCFVHAGAVALTSRAGDLHPALAPQDADEFAPTTHKPKPASMLPSRRRRGVFVGRGVRVTRPP